MVQLCKIFCLAQDPRAHGKSSREPHIGRQGKTRPPCSVFGAEGAFMVTADAPFPMQRAAPPHSAPRLLGCIPLENTGHEGFFLPTPDSRLGYWMDVERAGPHSLIEHLFSYFPRPSPWRLLCVFISPSLFLAPIPSRGAFTPEPLRGNATSTTLDLSK